MVSKGDFPYMEMVDAFSDKYGYQALGVLEEGMTVRQSLGVLTFLP
jgi:hypothetical protein